jgi:HPt (histidine-containing phosphotransfer) domain-containing protein
MANTFNREQVIDNFSDDKEILLELIEKFIDKSGEYFLNIENAFKENNLKVLKISAHSLKGVISNFYADEIFQICYEIERKSESGNLENLSEKIILLKNKLFDLIEELKEFKATL